MPAKPRPAAFRDRVRETFERDFVDGDLLELARFDFVSPFSRPDLLALCLICSYCRARFGLAPRGI